MPRNLEKEGVWKIRSLWTPEEHQEIIRQVAQNVFRDKGELEEEIKDFRQRHGREPSPVLTRDRQSKPPVLIRDALPPDAKLTRTPLFTVRDPKDDEKALERAIKKFMGSGPEGTMPYPSLVTSRVIVHKDIRYAVLDNCNGTLAVYLVGHGDRLHRLFDWPKALEQIGV